VLTKYGVDVLIKYAVLASVIVAGTLLFVESAGIRYSILSIVVLFTLFVLNFFRDPERVTPQEENNVISPADGKVVVIKELFEGEYLKSDAVQVSVFMSPLNVHVNRFPISGTIGYFKYIPGKYLVAFEEKSSEVNERTHIGVEQNGYKVLFKQIAGAVARRIVADLKVGQPATKGERFGMIKFGSRVDVIMPKGSVVNVQLNQHVVAGETVLATYSSKGSA
jgi:phosphatidylserine decarboxylase